MGQDPVVLDPPCPLPTFCVLKTFSQRIILIREVRTAEAKENSKGYQTTIMQSLKKARAIDTFWAASSKLLTDSESPTGCGRWLHDDRLQPSHRLPQSWELASKKLGTNWPWNWRLTLLKRIETTGWSISPWLPELTLLFLHEGLSLCIWNLLPTDHWGRDGAGLWAGTYPLPPPQLTASRTKQTFLSTFLSYSLAFEWWKLDPTFRSSINLSHGKGRVVIQKLDKTNLTSGYMSKSENTQPYQVGKLIFP